MSGAEKIEFQDGDCRPGVERGDWHGGPFTVVRYRYAPGSRFPSHSHGAAQVTVVLEGKIEFEVEGERFELGAGDSIFIAGDAPHSATVPADSVPVVSINVFTPPRKEHP